MNASPSGMLVAPCHAPASGSHLETLHASAVLTSAGVVAFCARSGTGKSTLATHLQHRGYERWADDAVVWAIGDPGVLTFRGPADGTDAAAAGDSSGYPLAAVLALERIDDDGRGGDEVDAYRVTGAAALTAVLPHAHPSRTTADVLRQRQFLLRYVHLAAMIPVFRLRFRHDSGRIDALCDTVECMLASIGAGRSGR